MSAKAPLTVLGLGIAICGLSLNQWTLAWLFHRTHFNNPMILGVLWAMDLFLIVWGLLLPRQAWAHKLLYALLPMVLVYVIVELCFIFVFHRNEPEWFTYRRTHWTTFQVDARLGYKLRPNLRNIRYQWNNGENQTFLDTDALGFRNLGLDYERSRMFFIGDSFVYGESSTRDDSAIHQLELLRKEPIINLGVSGYDLTQYEEIFRQFTEHYHPKVVAFGIFANDLHRPIPVAQFVEQQTEMLLRYGRYSLYSRSLAYTLAKAYEDVRSPLRNALASNSLTLFADYGPSPRYNDQGEDREVEAALLRIMDLAQQRHVRLVVFLFPAKESVYRSEYLRLFPDHKKVLDINDRAYARLAELAHTHGTTVLDLTSGFRREASRVLYFHIDAHWNREGNRLAAELMAPVLDETLAR